MLSELNSRIFASKMKFFQTLLFILIVLFPAQLIAQIKVLECPGEYKFSVKHTFYQTSKKINPSSVEYTERNSFGQQTKWYRVSGDNDTGTMYCNEFDENGLKLKAYTINSNRDTSFTRINRHNDQGDVVEYDIQGMKRFFEYNYDDNEVSMFSGNSHSKALLEKWYLNENKDVIKIERFHNPDVIFEVVTIKYLDNDIQEETRLNTSSKEAITDRLKTFPSRSLMLRTKTSADGTIDTLINKLPIINPKKPLIHEEYAHYDYGGHPDYEIDTFANGLTSRIAFDNEIMRDGSFVYYTLNAQGRHAERFTYEHVYAADYEQYLLVNILTGEEKFSGESTLNDWDTDEDGDVENSKPDPDIMLNEIERVYHLGSLETDTIYNEGWYEGYMAFYRSYIGYTKFHYDVEGRIVRHEVIHGPNDDVHFAYAEYGILKSKITESYPDFMKQEQFEYNNEGKLSLHSVSYFQADSFIRTDSFGYDVNGNRTLFNQGGHWVKEEYENTLIYPELGEGRAHEMHVMVPSKGKWTFDLTDSSEFVLQLTNPNGKVIKPTNQGHQFKLEKGRYILRIAARNKSDSNGVYDLSIHSE